MTTCLGHSCRQGRAECKTPHICSYVEQRAYQAAEAATELGVDDDDGLPPHLSYAERALLVLIGTVSISIVGALALHVWSRFA